MKEVPLTRGCTAFVDDYDYELVSRYSWWAEIPTRKDGTFIAIYAAGYFGKVNGKKIVKKLHRFILGIDDPKIQVDHRDHDGLNCCRSNLRIATQSQNQANAVTPRNNTSKFKGVSVQGKRWRARISVDDKRICIGSFDTREQAALAYNLVAVVRFGEFAFLNKVA